MSDLSIRKIKNTSFPALYKKLLIGEILTEKEQEKLLQIAVIFINSDNLYVNRLGYRIIVLFSNRFDNYAPLYEISINQGLYPISHFIEQYLVPDSRKNFFTELNESYTQIFNNNGIYQSAEQYGLNKFYSSNIENSVSIIAPTSYGKTELILSTIQQEIGKNICILTPTKSLLAQTRKRILSAKIPGIRKIVVHPEMFNATDPFCIAVLTQERLMRLLKNNPTYCFECIIVDEAHNILSSDSRDELLASVIMILNKRNPNATFKFLTPFINDSDNLKVRYTSYDLATYRIKEYIKTEKVYAYDLQSRSGLHFYDQFLNKWFDIIAGPIDMSDVGFLLRHGGDKNIVYFNKPSDIEDFAKKMISVLPDLELTPELSRVITNISEYLSPEYTLVKCLRKGIIYHHGSVPDSIRQYIEFEYSSIKEIRFVLTSSTLLEGVNLPAEKMFLLDNRKGLENLSPSSFKNLIGRICRFSEVFDGRNTSLKRLEPEIYLLVGDYFRDNANYKSFVSGVMKVDIKLHDECENVLLESTEITPDTHDKLEQAKEFVENYETGTIENYNARRVVTEIGRSCIQNSITEFDVFSHEEILQTYVDSLKSEQFMITTCEQLIELLNSMFVPFIDVGNNNYFLRFRNDAARKYYTMFLNQKISNDTYAQMIGRTVRYWNSLIEQRQDTFVYVGKWGDSTRGIGFREFWTDISQKSHAEKINLAIVRIKEEQDFIDNAIMKFVEVLFDIRLIDPSLYLRLKYGTDNPVQISLIKNGISLSLSKLLIDKYAAFVSIDTNSDAVEIDSEILNAMSQNGENDILVYEAKNNVFAE